MINKKKRITKDFETRSLCNLKTAGAYKYSLHPSTQPTCLSFKFHGQDVVYLLDFKDINTPWKKLPYKFKNRWEYCIQAGYEFSAHNSFFERCIYDNIMVKRYGWPAIPPRQRRCTAAKAAACALPRNLEGAGAALKLTTQKDKTGYIAMMKTCKPTRQWNAWKKLQDDIAAGKRITERRMKSVGTVEPKMFLDPEDDPQTWNNLYKYCKIDTKTEELLDDTLPDLNAQEQELWFLNQEVNWRGLLVDLPTVKKIVGISELEKKTRLKELDALTMGLVTSPNSRKSVMEFLKLDGIEIADIKAKTVEDLLKGGKLNPDMKRLLEIRKELSKASLRKYKAFMDRACDDNRVRDIALYHGASTGRDTGVGIQPHNFPRGLIKVDKDMPYRAIQDILDYDVDFLKLLYGDDLSILFSAVLRNMLIPTKGKKLFVADFSKIEVAVLWWLSGNEAGLKILRAGLDPYIYMASANTGKPYKEIELAVLNEERWAIDARQLGKAQVLGCGFGMGWNKFQLTAYEQYRLTLTDQQSKHAVKSYREKNKAVKDVWKAYESAAIRAVEDREVVKVNGCKFYTKDKFLWIELPSGRKLAYREPHIVMREFTYEVEEEIIVKGKVKIKIHKRTAEKKTLEFWAVNSKTKKWSVERTFGGSITENIVQAVARDLMKWSEIRVERAGYTSNLTVHDELITEKDKGTVDEFTKIMCKVPKWAKGCPIESKGWTGPRYRKG